VAFSRAIPAAPGRDGNWGSWEGSLVGDLVVGGEVLWAAGTKAEGVIQYRNRPTFLILKRLGGAEVQRAYQVASDYAKEAGLRNGNRDSVAVAFRAALGSESKLMRCPPVTFQIAE
jgi:predicted lipid-binding transport protein (Tim44 family)